MLYSRADMRLAVLAALGVGGRLENIELDLLPPELPGISLEFIEPDEKRFPCLALARQACLLGGAYPPLLVGADEGAVEMFMEGRISFTDIASKIESVLSSYSGSEPRSWEDALDLVVWGRERVLHG
jgi:1-deoxy-D-xylulose-5-phosphate reductoisomerase